MTDSIRAKSRGLTASALCFLLAVACVVPPTPAPDGGVPPKPGAPSPLEEEIIRYTNDARALYGIAPLRVSGPLLAAARLHATQMAGVGILAHDLPRARYPTLADRLKASAYPYLSAGENIGWNSPTPQAVVNGWMNSTVHRTNILHMQFTEIGTAMARNQKGEPYWVQVFGKPR